MVWLFTGEDANASVDSRCTGTPLGLSVDGNPWTAPKVLSTTGGDVDGLDDRTGGPEESCGCLCIFSCHTCKGLSIEIPGNDIASVCNSFSSFRLLEAVVLLVTLLESFEAVGIGFGLLGSRSARVSSLRAVALNLY